MNSLRNSEYCHVVSKPYWRPNKHGYDTTSKSHVINIHCTYLITNFGQCYSLKRDVLNDFTFVMTNGGGLMDGTLGLLT